MREPRRLLDEPGSSLGQDLLRSARRDAPTRSARARTMIALGVGTGILGAGVTAAGTSAASTGAGGILKWIGIGVLSGGLVVGGAEEARHITTPHIAAPAMKGSQQAAARATTPARAFAARVAEPPVAEAAIEPVPVVADEPAVDAPKPEAPARPVVGAHRAPSLSEELAEVGAADDALKRGDVERAQELLEQHDKQFGKAMLGPETMVLRMELLAQRGDKQGAASLASQFLAAYPESAYANKVRSIHARCVSGP
jgi:hypothetical protein